MVDGRTGISGSLRPSAAPVAAPTDPLGKLGAHDVQVVAAQAPRVSKGGWLANIRSLTDRLVQWVQSGFARTDFACRRAEEKVIGAMKSLTRELAHPHPQRPAVRNMLSEVTAAAQPLAKRGMADQRVMAAATGIVNGLDLKHRAALLAGVNGALRQGVDQSEVLAAIQQALDDARPQASRAALTALASELAALSSDIAKRQAEETAIDNGAPEREADYGEARQNGMRLGVTQVFLKDVARAHFTFEDTDSSQMSLTRWNGQGDKPVSRAEAIEGAQMLSRLLGHNRPMLMAVTSCCQGIFAPLLTTALSEPLSLPDGSLAIPVAAAGRGAGGAALDDKHWTFQKQPDGSVLVRAEMTQQLNQVQVLDGPSFDPGRPTRAIEPTSVRYALGVHVDTEGRFTPVSARLSLGAIKLTG